MSEFIVLDRKQVLLDKWDSVGKDLSQTINLAELIVDVWEVAAVTTEERIIKLLENNLDFGLDVGICDKESNCQIDLLYLSALIKGEK
jgi:hypothetical protein